MHAQDARHLIQDAAKPHRAVTKDLITAEDIGAGGSKVRVYLQRGGQVIDLLAPIHVIAKYQTCRRRHRTRLIVIGIGGLFGSNIQTGFGTEHRKFQILYSNRHGKGLRSGVILIGCTVLIQEDQAIFHGRILIGIKLGCVCIRSIQSYQHHFLNVVLGHVQQSHVRIRLCGKGQLGGFHLGSVIGKEVRIVSTSTQSRDRRAVHGKVAFVIHGLEEVIQLVGAGYLNGFHPRKAHPAERALIRHKSCGNRHAQIIHGDLNALHLIGC